MESRDQIQDDSAKVLCALKKEMDSILGINDNTSGGEGHATFRFGNLCTLPERHNVPHRVRPRQLRSTEGFGPLKDAESSETKALMKDLARLMLDTIATLLIGDNSTQYTSLTPRNTSNSGLLLEIITQRLTQCTRTILSIIEFLEGLEFNSTLACIRRGHSEEARRAKTRIQEQQERLEYSDSEEVISAKISSREQKKLLESIRAKIRSQEQKELLEYLGSEGARHTEPLTLAQGAILEHLKDLRKKIMELQYNTIEREWHGLKQSLRSYKVGVLEDIESATTDDIIVLLGDLRQVIDTIMQKKQRGGLNANCGLPEVDAALHGLLSHLPSYLISVIKAAHLVICNAMTKVANSASHYPASPHLFADFGLVRNTMHSTESGSSCQFSNSEHPSVKQQKWEELSTTLRGLVCTFIDRRTAVLNKTAAILERQLAIYKRRVWAVPISTKSEGSVATYARKWVDGSLPNQLGQLIRRLKSQTKVPEGCLALLRFCRDHDKAVEEGDLSLLQSHINTAEYYISELQQELAGLLPAPQTPWIVAVAAAQGGRGPLVKAPCETNQSQKNLAALEALDGSGALVKPLKALMAIVENCPLGKILERITMLTRAPELELGTTVAGASELEEEDSPKLSRAKAATFHISCVTKDVSKDLEAIDALACRLFQQPPRTYELPAPEAPLNIHRNQAGRQTTESVRVAAIEALACRPFKQPPLTYELPTPVGPVNIHRNQAGRQTTESVRVEASHNHLTEAIAHVSPELERCWRTALATMCPQPVEHQNSGLAREGQKQRHRTQPSQFEDTPSGSHALLANRCLQGAKEPQEDQPSLAMHRVTLNPHGNLSKPERE